MVDVDVSLARGIVEDAGKVASEYAGLVWTRGVRVGVVHTVTGVVTFRKRRIRVARKVVRLRLPHVILAWAFRRKRFSEAIAFRRYQLIASWTCLRPAP